MARVSRNGLLALIALALAVILTPVPTALADDANVFVYHRFNDSRYPSTNITTEVFKEHLEILRSERFTVLTLGQVVDRLRAGEPLPQRCAVVTIDDGYRSFLTDGWPLLREYGYPATLFVSTDTVGGGDFLSWQELRLLQKEGVEIGNHSASHDYLLDRRPTESALDWRTRVTEDLERATRAFEKYLGASSRLFAYPYGEFSPELIDLVDAAGFEAAFGQQSGVISIGQDLYALPRFPVAGSYSATEEFRSRLFMKSLPIGKVLPQDNVIMEENPPTLKFNLNAEGVDQRTLRCFVSGQDECLLKEVSGVGGGYEVKAIYPLVGRRSKYTVTASDSYGKTWYWYSQLWVAPRRSDMADQPVAR